MKEVLQIKTTKKLTKQQESFNKLVKQIEKRSDELVYLEDGLKKFTISKQQILGEILIEQLNTKLKYAQVLDEMFENNKFTKKEKEKLIQIILNVSNPIYPDFKEIDDKLTDIYDKYNRMKVSNVSKEDMEYDMSLMQMMFKEMGFDIDFSGIDGFSMKDMKEKVMEQMKAKLNEGKQDEEDEAKYQRKNKHSSGLSDKAKENAQKLNKSWKQIYLSLVKHLHPDTEKDETLKLEKEAVLKEVTTAYDENNFFKLLHLQIKYTNSTDLLEKADDKTLQEFVKILKQQSAEIGCKIEDVKDALIHNNADFIIQRGGIQLIEQKLKQQRKEIEIDIELIKNETIYFSDIKVLKQELKKVSLNDLDSSYGFDDFDLPF